MAYKLNRHGGVVRARDKAFIPECLDNVDWREYLEWVTKGNTPDPAETPEEATAREEVVTQEKLIVDKMRELAVTELKREGKLPGDFRLPRMMVVR